MGSHLRRCAARLAMLRMGEDMVGRIYHVGLTVSDIERSIAFYRDVLGLAYQSQIIMSGPETDILFGREGSGAKVAYLNGSDSVEAPPIELIQFESAAVDAVRSDLFRTSISEVCFQTDDIAMEYERLCGLGVECLSTPQFFDFSDQGLGASWAFYFRDPDGIVLEMMQAVQPD